VKTPLVCPRCGAENILTYRELKTLDSIECKGCGTTIQFKKDESFLNLERDVNESLDDFSESLKSMKFDIDLKF
jgi:DNA-directed RNA polymerase subunit RPC12/RpoP